MKNLSISWLSRQAKLLSKTAAIPKHQALDQVARNIEGFKDWEELVHYSKNPKPQLSAQEESILEAYLQGGILAPFNGGSVVRFEPIDFVQMPVGSRALEDDSLDYVEQDELKAQIDQIAQLLAVAPFSFNRRLVIDCINELAFVAIQISHLPQLHEVCLYDPEEGRYSLLAADEFDVIDYYANQVRTPIVDFLEMPYRIATRDGRDIVTPDVFESLKRAEQVDLEEYYRDFPPDNPDVKPQASAESLSGSYTFHDFDSLTGFSSEPSDKDGLTDSEGVQNLMLAEPACKKPDSDSFGQYDWEPDVPEHWCAEPEYTRSALPLVCLPPKTRSINQYRVAYRFNAGMWLYEVYFRDHPVASLQPQQEAGQDKGVANVTFMRTTLLSKEAFDSMVARTLDVGKEDEQLLAHLENLVAAWPLPGLENEFQVNPLDDILSTPAQQLSLKKAVDLMEQAIKG